ncbi:HD-GYP domain-containing protein [Deinococcus psychrotolerans]|uniref:HD-GYP domain-containing protein n=1 Tax=Deinococcus psychrotolerans TaxID=2489213 RepID=A0A3G8YGK3_9DEIO|nr:HD-GYP domain-containing protein [Deinococcus psychrotolerans]AZI44093.1 HD-GYP domain-containing protein [Deinococcus psychrotolerans]
MFPDDDLLMPKTFPLAQERGPVRPAALTNAALLMSEQPTALFLLDQSGRIQSVGGAWNAVTETVPEDIIGTPLSLLLRLPVDAYPQGMLSASGQTTQAWVNTRTGQRRIFASWRHHGDVIAGHFERFGSGYLERASSEGQRLQSALDEAVYCMGTTLDTGSDDHVRRMVQLSTRLAEILQLSPDEIKAVRWGAALHDVGKSRIPVEILQKPGPLNADEIKLIQQHPAWGVEILQPLTFLTDGVLAAVLHHHERFGGGGYPTGLAGAAIPITARIVAVADVFDALISSRPYKKAWTSQAATEYLIAGTGTQFDPELVRAFTTEVLGFPACKHCT